MKNISKKKLPVYALLRKIRYVILLAFILNSSILNAQQPIDCGTQNSSPPSFLPVGGNCSYLSPDFNARYFQQGSYVPYATDNFKVINLSFNIFQDDLGLGNFTNDNDPNHGKGWLINTLLVSLNECFGMNSHITQGLINGHLASDWITGVVDVPDARIQFDLGPPGQERIFFYQSTFLRNTDIYDDHRFRIIPPQDNTRTDQYSCLQIYFCYSGGYAGFVNQFPWLNFWDEVGIMSNRAYNNGNPDGFTAKNLSHELAHTLALHHLYDDEPCSPVDYDYLDDVFGIPTPIICPHDGVCTTSFDSPVDGCDNNIMDGHETEYFSPKQVGRMHRTLALLNTRKYLKDNDYRLVGTK